MPPLTFLALTRTAQPGAVHLADLEAPHLLPVLGVVMQQMVDQLGLT
jgi:hypothetical protein